MSFSRKTCAKQRVQLWCCLKLAPKREIRHFLVVVVQRRQRNVPKSVMHVQSCCFACLNLLLFFRPRCRRPRSCLSSLLRTPLPPLEFEGLFYL